MSQLVRIEFSSVYRRTECLLGARSLRHWRRYAPRSKYIRHVWGTFGRLNCRRACCRRPCGIASLGRAGCVRSVVLYDSQTQWISVEFHLCLSVPCHVLWWNMTCHEWCISSFRPLLFFVFVSRERQSPLTLESRLEAELVRWGDFDQQRWIWIWPAEELRGGMFY
jgi:hypothetical protein